jgi:hypothetical protein
MSFLFFFKDKILHMHKNIGICLSQSGLFHLTWWLPVLSIFLKWHSFYGWLIFLCVCVYVSVRVSRFLYLFISLWICMLIP